MNSKRWLIISGTLISLILLLIVLTRLDWPSFFTALTSIQWPPILFAALLMIVAIALRALRWNLVAGLPLTQFKRFWQAVNIGYLGNLIYPARAGEILKMLALHHFTGLVFGRAAASAVIDRMIDLISAGLLTMVILWIHGDKINSTIANSVITIFIISLVILIILILTVNFLQTKAQQWTPPPRWQRWQQWYLHALEAIQAFRQVHNLLFILPLSLFTFMLDYYYMWLLMGAFNWSLPYEAAMTTGVFIVIGISLPSAPGYIGIYQVACVLALALYGIPEAQAVAYSIVLQLLGFGIIGVQGMLVMLYCGFSLSRQNTNSIAND